ncbi:MAG: glutamate ligase domain-containing protein, partial [Chitinophagales bacterium]
NIGKSHLEGFGGLEGVIKGKSELYDFLIANRGVLLHNSHNRVLADKIAGYDSVYTYGVDPHDYLYGIIHEHAAFAEVEMDNVLVHSKLVGSFNGYNMLAAACVGKYFDIPLEQIKWAIENYQPQNNRSQWQQYGDNYFILDAYNANPSSMQAAIDHFDKMQVQPKILILGDMLELGAYAETEHRQILNAALKKSFMSIILVGSTFSSVAPPEILHFPSVAEAKEWFDAQQFHNTYFLIKGSRGIKLEKITEDIR